MRTPGRTPAALRWLDYRKGEGARRCGRHNRAGVVNGRKGATTEGRPIPPSAILGERLWQVCAELTCWISAILS